MSSSAVSAAEAHPRFFLCIGAQKSGTTWLAEQLRKHPEFAFPPRKELRYFDTVHVEQFAGVRGQRLLEFRSRLEQSAKRDARLDPVKARTLLWHAKYAIVADEDYSDDWYWSLFDGIEAGKWTGDFSTTYSMLPNAGIEHLGNCASHAKIVFVLRNPVDRTWSGAVYAARREITRDGQPPSAKRLRTAAMGKIQQTLSDYRRTLEVYESVLGRGSVNVLFYDILCEDPARFLRMFCDVVGAPFRREWFDGLSKRVNEGPRVPRDQDIIREVTQAVYDQLQWLSERFGGVAEIWRQNAEQAMTFPAAV